MCMRIWSGFSKFIKSQCNKDRVIDTLFFGSFYAGENEYVFVSEGKGQGAFGEFKLLTNSQNEHEIPINIQKSKDYISANLTAIAQVCNCTTDNVHQFLTKFRD